MQSPACGLKLGGVWARVACGAWARITATKPFVFDCFWSLPYIREKNIHIQGCHSKNTYFISDFMTKMAKKL